VIEVGLSATLEAVVGEADTATAFGSGDVPVLGTPRLVALLEAAAVAAVAGALPTGATSVGTNITMNHLAATAVGRLVTGRAEVVDVTDRMIVFGLEARDGEAIIAQGRHVRVVVDRERFLSRATLPDTTSGVDSSDTASSD
jgi:predicted thioesterase